MRLVLATSWLSRMRGLLGTQSDWGDGKCVLVLLPCSSVHTFGMRYALDIAFVSKDGIVVRTERNVAPSRVLLCRHAYATFEKPAAKVPWLKMGERVPLSFR